MLTMNFRDVLPSGVYATRGGGRVRYYGDGFGKFLPDGTRLVAWDAASGRYLDREHEHPYDLVRRVDGDDDRTFFFSMLWALAVVCVVVCGMVLAFMPS